MASLTGTKVSDTYQQLLKLTSQGVGADASAKYIEDGLGTDTALSLSTTRIGIGTSSPARTLDVVGDIQASSLIKSSVSSNSTNLATANGGTLILENSHNTDGNFSNIGGYNTNGLVTSQINFVNVSQSSRHGAITLNTHNGTSLTERVRVDKDGNVGIGVSPTTKFEVQDANAIPLRFGDIASTPTATAGYIGMSTAAYNGHNGDLILIPRTSTPSDVCLMGDKNGVGTSQPSAKLHVAGGAGNDVEIHLGDADGDRAELIYRNDCDFEIRQTCSTGAIQIINEASRQIEFHTANTQSMRVAHDGDVMIGSGEPAFGNGDGLEIERAGTATLRLENTSTSKGYEIYLTDDLVIDAMNSGSNIILLPETKVGIGTNLTEGNIDSGYAGELLNLRVANSGTHSALDFFWEHSNSSTGIEQRIQFHIGDDDGGDSYGDSGYIGIGKEDTWNLDGNRDSYLAFGTASNNSQGEGLRITSGGPLLASGTTTNTSLINNTHTFYANQADTAFAVDNQSSGNAFGIQVRYSTTGHGTGGYPFSFYANPSGSLQARFIVYEDGDVENSNNSYTGLSDQRIKKDITDANSQWDDIKALRVVNFKRDETGGDAVHIGVIAQEVESAGMNGLIRERDASDIDIENFPNINEGDKIKSLKYSVLYMKAVKALQEAMTRIETLEARLDDLEPEEPEQEQSPTVKERVNSLEARVNDLENG